MNGSKKNLQMKCAGLLSGSLLALTLLTGQVFSQQLDIKRRDRLAPALQDVQEVKGAWVEVEGGLFKARFRVPRAFLTIYSGSGEEAGGAVDPFAEIPDDAVYEPRRASAREVLEQAGVEFGEKGKVVYNARTSTLIVVAEQGQLELVEAYFSSGCRLTPRLISVRAEIYELPSHLALEVVESCQAEGDHTPERDAVLKLVKDGQARLIAMPSLLAKSGQRSRIIDAVGLSYAKKLDLKAGEDKNKKSVFKIQSVGTILEADLVLGADEWTVDLTIHLEHHTAAPVLGPTAERMQTPQAHNKEIITQLVMYSGNYLLIGTWKPTGKKEYQEKDLTHVVFLTANVQNQGEYGLLETAKK
ncbi:MAG: hypothetical protein L3J39_19325 [Verrucomicrobiales bacterium]|nr:hypothetical protein [Verrucomicrobiales bacterium]